MVKKGREIRYALCHRMYSIYVSCILEILYANKEPKIWHLVQFPHSIFTGATEVMYISIIYNEWCCKSHLSNLLISCRQDVGYTCHLKFLNGSDSSVKHSGLLGFGISQLCGIIKKQHFRNWLCFHPQVGDTMLDPLERAKARFSCYLPLTTSDLRCLVDSCS
jgi:hypothetical protein